MKDHRKERAEARKKAEKLVSQMTLLEKASQLKYDAAPVKRLGRRDGKAVRGGVHQRPRRYQGRDRRNIEILPCKEPGGPRQHQGCERAA